MDGPTLHSLWMKESIQQQTHSKVIERKAMGAERKYCSYYRRRRHQCSPLSVDISSNFLVSSSWRLIVPGKAVGWWRLGRRQGGSHFQVNIQLWCTPAEVLLSFRGHCLPGQCNMAQSDNVALLWQSLSAARKRPRLCPTLSAILGLSQHRKAKSGDCGIHTRRQTDGPIETIAQVCVCLLQV